MRTAFIRRYGDNSVVEVGDLPRPVPGPHDVLIEVRAASVNPLDFKTRAGKTRALLHYEFPLVLGNDCAGVVTETGREVTAWKPGDEVFVRLGKDRIGSFAEYALAPESVVAAKPGNLDFIQAASVPLAGLTSWQALVDVAGLGRGQRVLIHAGSGGVGTFAIQIARHLGAVVVTTAGRRNHDLVRGLGAQVVIDHRGGRFEDHAGTCDVVFDTIGGDVQRRSFAVLRRGGVLVSVAGLPTARVGREWGAGTPVRAVLWLANLRSSVLARRRGVRFEYLLMRADGPQLSHLARLIEARVIRPVIDRVFPLSQAAEALAYQEAGHASGKVIITP